jgi:D-alanyl-D-alanine carboxypeptidase
MFRTVFAFLILSVSLSAAANSTVSSEQAAQISADVDAVLRHTETPGATIAIAELGHIVYSHAYGLRDSGHHLPATQDTYYEIGSITKQLTAAAIMQLQEAGKLRIDDTLATHLPDAPHAGEVTLRQLLSHTSGLSEYLTGPNIELEATQSATFDQLLARIAGKPLDFAPGSHWAYSNTNYILLGRIIEVVSHETYRHYVQTHLLNRAGMKQTFTVSDETHLPNMAIGYHHTDGRINSPTPISESFGWAAGSLVSTVSDLEKWNAALMSGRIVSSADYAMMSTSVKLADQTDAGYGFGLFVDTIDGQPRVGHTGGSFGFTTANEYFPKQGVQIIAFTNNGDDPEPGEMITTAIFEDLYPTIAAATNRPNAGEDSAVTAEAKAVFEQLQRGTGEFTQLTDKLAKKMKDGQAQRVAAIFGPYGAATAFVYKGEREQASLKWFDYVVRFGPGSVLKFAIGVDDAGKVASISYG